MKLMIRTDANNFIATGHVMRCISIAQVAIMEGHVVKFVVADFDAKSLLEKYNMPYICLNTIWNEMDGEIEKVQKVINDEKPDCILVDSYYVTEKYLLALRSMCKVAYIDDLGKNTYPCDFLICYAGYYKDFLYEKRYLRRTKLLLGTQYAPLRKEYMYVDKIRKSEISFKKNILLLSGGTDSYHVIAQFLYEWCRQYGDMNDIYITAVCGEYNMDYEEIKNRFNYNNISIIKSVENLKEYMLSADIAISAAGTTLYELCACAVPTVCYTLADNQLYNAKWFAEQGCMNYVGDVRNDKCVKKMCEEAIKLLYDTEKIQKMTYKLRLLVDGLGAKRIVNKILGEE